MFSSIPTITRHLSTVSRREVRREVIISQSLDQVSNVALEDWMVRKVDLSQRSMLILTNSLTRSSTLEMKATLLDSDSYSMVGDLENLVLSSLTPSLPLTRLSGVARMWEMVDRSSSTVSLQLELSRDRIVLEGES